MLYYGIYEQDEITNNDETGTVWTIWWSEETTSDEHTDESWTVEAGVWEETSWTEWEWVEPKKEEEEEKKEEEEKRKEEEEKDEEEDEDDNEEEEIRKEIDELKYNLDRRPEWVIENLRKMDAANETYRENNLELKQDNKDLNKQITILETRLEKKEAALEAKSFDEFDRKSVALAQEYSPLLKSIEWFMSKEAPDKSDYAKVKMYFDDLAEKKGIYNVNTYTKKEEKPILKSALFSD